MLGSGCNKNAVESTGPDELEENPLHNNNRDDTSVV